MAALFGNQNPEEHGHREGFSRTKQVGQSLVRAGPWNRKTLSASWALAGDSLRENPGKGRIVAHFLSNRKTQ